MWEKIKKPVLCLAPMAGVTDSAFRLSAKKQGADIVYSEMASVAALFHRPEKTLEMLKFSKEEKPYIVQLFGKEPEYFAKATRLISQGVPLIDYSTVKDNLSVKNLKPSGIDINFGCPAKKVFGHGSGAALMAKPKLAQKIIQQVVAGTELPVSIKVRAEAKGVKLLPFLKKIKVNSLGLQAIMVHGRTYSQGFSGSVDYESIKKVKTFFNGIVIANGNVHNLKSAREMLTKTGVDGLGIATGSYGSPDLFKQLLRLKKTNQNQPTNEKSLKAFCQSKAKLALSQAQYVSKLKGKRGIIEMRKHLLWYFKGVPNIKKFKPDLVKVTTLRDIQLAIQKITNSVK